MRKIKIILGILLGALLLNVVVFFVFTVNGYDAVYNLVKDYSAKEIDIYDDEFSEYDNIDVMLKNNVIFCVTEHAGVKVNYDILRNNIVFFQKNYNLKYLVTDLSYSEALWINQYIIQDAPAEALSEILMPEELMEIFLDIKQINLRLNDKAKIEVIGINSEKSADMPAAYINYLFEQFADKRKPGVINDAVNFDDENEIQYYRNMYNSLLSNERLYREYFVDKYFPFYMTLRNYMKSVDNVDNALICLNNFIDIFNYNIRAKYYIQLPWDLRLYENLSLEYPNIADEIFSMTLFYDDCDSIYSEEFYQYPFDLHNDGTPKNYILNNKIFKHFEKHRRLVHKINNRPYESYDTELGDEYLILTNSPAVTLPEVSNDNS